MPINFVVKAAVTAVAMGAQIALGAMRKIEGPRLDNRKVTTSQYGTPLVKGVWGITRLSGCPLTWAEDLDEKKKKTKTKGGKYAEYKYYFTGEYHLCDVPIDAVRKIWLDNHLVYQVAGEGPIAALILTAIDPAAQGAEIKLSQSNIAIYLGSDDQMPDPRQEAWFEDQYGPNSCSAHRGTARIIFKNIPVDKFGNRPPTLDAEVVRIKEASFPYEQRTTTRPTGIWFFGGGFGIFVDGGFIEWWDAASRTNLGTSPAYGVLVGSTVTALGDDGIAYGVGTSSPPPAAYLIRTAPLAQPILDAIDSPASLFFSNVRVFGGTAYLAYTNAEGYVRHTTHIPDAAGLRGRDFAVNDDGEVCVLMQPAGSSDQFVIRNTTDNSEISFTALSTRSGPNNSRFCITKWGKWFVDDPEGEFYIVNPETGVIEVSGSAGWAQPAFLNAQTNGSTSLWDFIGSFDEYSLEDGSLIRSYSPFDWVFANTTSHSAYDPVTHAIWSEQSSSSNIHIRYLDRVGSNGITLGTIVDEVSDWAGVTADVTALDQLVQGYSVTPGTGREMIEPLLDIYDSLCRTHDFTVQFIKRASDSLGIIDVEDFVREGDSPRYEIDEDTGLPREAVVSYADKNKDHQANTVTSRRDAEAVDLVRRQQINLETWVSTPDEAQSLADRWLRGKHNRKATVKNAITAKYLAAEAGDVYDLNLDGVLWTVEIEKLTLMATSPQAKVEWRRTFPSLLGSQAGPDMLGKDEDVILVPGPTKGFLLDIPYTSDDENAVNPLLHYAAGAYGISGWPGAAILEGDLSGDEYGEWNAVPANDNAIWGQTTDALGDANPNLWDRGNTFSVRVFNGTLSNSTEAAINADPTINQFVLSATIDGEKHWEIANFTTATLTATTTTYREYDISGLLRGRRGTEWATGSHAAGDDFLLVSSVLSGEMGLSEVGAAQYFKAQTYGRDPELAPVQTFPFEGESLMPYAPAIHRVTKDDATGDITITLDPRTRIGGAWNGSTIPTGETISEFEFDVYDGTTFERTLESSTGVFTYSDADQTTDFGSTLAAEDLEGFAYQLSASVGRGFARAA